MRIARPMAFGWNWRRANRLPAIADITYAGKCSVRVPLEPGRESTSKQDGIDNILVGWQFLKVSHYKGDHDTVRRFEKTI